MARERWQLTLESLPSDVPSANRLRRGLKCLLRSFGLRCLEVRPLAEPDAKPAIPDVPVELPACDSCNIPIPF